MPSSSKAEGGPVIFPKTPILFSTTNDTCYAEYVILQCELPQESQQMFFGFLSKKYSPSKQNESMLLSSFATLELGKRFNVLA